MARSAIRSAISVCAATPTVRLTALRSTSLPALNPARAFAPSRRRTEASIRASVSRPLVTAPTTVSIAVVTLRGISRTSAPASSANISGSVAPYRFAIPPIVIASVNKRPPKRISSRRIPVMNPRERVAGAALSPSIPMAAMWPVMIASIPPSIALRNGGRSTESISARFARIDGRSM